MVNCSATAPAWIFGSPILSVPYPPACDLGSFVFLLFLAAAPKVFLGLIYSLLGHLEIHSCVLQDIGPLGPLPCSHSITLDDYLEQGIGYHWPCVILGRLISLLRRCVRGTLIKAEMTSFLVADMQLYKRLCLSVGPSIGPSVRKSFKSCFKHF